jgi:HSP20 family molecular chaperone IbpA
VHLIPGSAVEGIALEGPPSLLATMIPRMKVSRKSSVWGWRTERYRLISHPKPGQISGLHPMFPSGVRSVARAEVGHRLASQDTKQSRDPTSADAFTLQIALPGLDPDQVEVRTAGQQVMIKGSSEIPLEKDAAYRWQGLASGEFTETFTLPVDVEGEKATARYERGILSITLPKAEKAKAATIKVQKVT